MIYLVKANDDLISHCRCSPGPIGAPGQAGCPWCGCGWMFCCPRCRKAFVFARAEEVDVPWDVMARLDLEGRWHRRPSEEEVEEWIGFMKILQKGLRPGATYVYLDGYVFRSDQTDLRFEGWHSKHEFARAPQAVGLELIERTIGTREYWESRRVLTEE